MNVFTDGLAVMTKDGPQLVASRCTCCGAIEFPRQTSCRRCTEQAVVDELLADTGVLWSWTVQRFPPKAPFVGGAAFEPFGVGYIELAGQLRVEARLKTADPEKLRIGLPMRLVVDATAATDPDACAIYEFEPHECAR